MDKIILKETNDYAIMRYNKLTIALFTEEKWGKSHKEEFKAVGASWNKYITHENRKGCWIFKYSDPKTKEYFSTTFDIIFDDIPLEKTKPKVDDEQKKIIYEKSSKGIYVVKYSEKSIVIFAPKEWGEKNKEELLEYGGLWNKNVTYEDKTGGWLFKLKDSKEYIEEKFSIIL